MIDVEPGAGGARSISGTMTNSGTLHFGVTGNVTGSLSNTAAGTIDVNPSAPCCDAVPTIVGNLINAGLVRLSSSVSQNSGLTMSSGTLTNSGTVELLPGAGGTRELNGTVSNSGTLTVATPSNLSGNYTINSGTVNLSSATPVSLNTLTITGGTLGGSGEVNVSGLITCVGSGSPGAMGGSGVTNALGGMSITGFDMTGTRVLNIFGTTTNSLGSGVRMLGTNIINNHGTFEMQTSTNIEGSTGTFNNLAGATFRKTGASQSLVTSAFNNAGTVEVQSSTLQMTGGSTYTGGSVSVAAPATLLFSSSTHNLNAGASFSGPGTVRMTGCCTPGPMLNINGGYNVGTTSLSGTSTFNVMVAADTVALNFDGLTGGILTGGGEFNVSGLTTWNFAGAMGGTGVTNANGGIIGSGNLGLQGSRVLNIFGPSTQASGAVMMSGTAVINNHGAYVMQSSTSVNGSSAQTFNNLPGATLRMSGAALSTFAVALNNSGVLEIQSSTLQLSGTSTHTGSVFVDTPGTLHFAAGTHNLNAGASFSGPGTVTLASCCVPGSTLNVNGDYDVGVTTLGDVGTLNVMVPASTGALSFTAGLLTGSGTLNVSGLTSCTFTGTMGGTGVTNANGGLSLTATLTLQDSRVLNTFGTSTQPTTATLSMSGSSIINNHGTYHFPGPGNVLGSSAQAFNNLAGATLRKSGAGSTAHINVAVSNAGRIQSESGNLHFVGGYTQTNGETLLVGGQVQSSSPVQVQGGIVAGDGTITGSVNNTGGTISPGLNSAGQITISGDYSQGPGGELEMEIGGTAPGEIDELHIAGNTDLGGLLLMRTRDTYIPDLGEEYDILFVMGGMNGQFNAVQGSGQYDVGYLTDPPRRVHLTTLVSPLLGDVDGDCDVDLNDLSQLLSSYGCQGITCGVDIEGDGDTDLNDLSLLLSAYGTQCP
jgi:hypothetical protein